MAAEEKEATMSIHSLGKQSDGALFVWLLVGILAIIAICSIFWFANRNTTVSSLGNVGEVVIGETGFTPATLKVKKGAVVTWNNRGVAQHEIASDQAALELGTGEPLEIGDAYSHYFTKSGTYTYYDVNNPAQFRGTVIVE